MRAGGAPPGGVRYGAELVAHLVGREFRLRYRQSLFGWLWAAGEPLARLAVLTFLFTRVVELDIENYPVFLFTGIMGWGWFSAGVLSSTASAADRRELLFRPGVPREAPPFVSALTDGVDYVAALPVLLLFVALSVGLGPAALALPVVLAVQLLLILGLGLALCAADVHFRDVRHGVAVLLTIGFYATPVLYDASFVPDRYRFVVTLNPMAHLIEAQRAVLVDGRLPDPVAFGAVTLVCLATFFAGLAIYRRFSPTFVDQL